MKTIKLLIAILPFFLLLSCVTKKKYNTLESEYMKFQSADKSCEDQLRADQALIAELKNQKSEAQQQADYLKQNNNKVVDALQDMSVLSSKQAESIKQSMEDISKKDAYIMNLQSAIARKDSMNLILTTNLKGALSDVNDQDVTVKVEKGVIYVDISDKMLFNSGKYTVTAQAKKVLGKIAQVLNAHPDIEFMVEGHTDGVPIHTDCLDDNWDLSVHRATSVIRILEHEYKIDPKRMTASGHSKFIPVATNETAEGRALNRRTRIIILPELDQFFKLVVRH